MDLPTGIPKMLQVSWGENHDQPVFFLGDDLEFPVLFRCIAGTQWVDVEYCWAIGTLRLTSFNVIDIPLQNCMFLVMGSENSYGFQLKNHMLNLMGLQPKDGTEMHWTWFPLRTSP